MLPILEHSLKHHFRVICFMTGVMIAGYLMLTDYNIYSIQKRIYQSMPEHSTSDNGQTKLSYRSKFNAWLFNSWKIEKDHPLSPVMASINVGRIYNSINIMTLLLASGFLFVSYKQYRNSVEQKKIAEQKLKEKVKFIDLMTHELRTPMLSIQGLSNLLARSKNLDQNEIQDIEIIQRAATKQMSLINQMLEYTRYSSGKLHLNCEPFKLKTLIDDTTDLFHHQFKEKGVLFDIDYDSKDDTEWIGDINRLQMVLQNLLSNALKFTQAGNVKLKVWLGNSKSEQQEICFEVIDSGCGIAQDQQKKLWKPFSQAAAHQGKLGGTGLGLTVSKVFVELMGGKIELHSKPEQGTKIKFNIFVYCSQPVTKA